ncbi:hypothetical protein [Streptomyces sp. NPDC020607]|uniref:AMP-binding enzyme n=1 Tax=Streptomyces sp. NPDC020607 TaxID=3365082 RepID=UPI0037B62D23
MGRLDEQGRLLLADRAKDIIHHARGTHIYPRVIEEALLQHPLVREAAVFGVADTDTGSDRVHARPHHLRTLRRPHHPARPPARRAAPGPLRTGRHRDCRRVAAHTCGQGRQASPSAVLPLYA